MAEPVTKSIERMEPDRFLDWCTHQDASWELVDGVPRMMVGARKAHDRVVRSVLTLLTSRLRGGPCEPFSEALAVKIPGGNVRRPDVTVDCGDQDPDLLHADRPVLVVEVLSPSTRQIDLVRKLAEYQRVPTIRYILLIEPEDPMGILHVREANDGWTAIILDTPDSQISIPDLGLTLTLAEFYA